MTDRNRITEHASEVRNMIAAGGVDGKLSTADAQWEFDMEFDLEPMEHFAYQEAQARAHVSGRITADEAMVVYRALGEVMASKNGGWQSHVDTALKVSITMLMGTLIGEHVQNAG